MLKEKAINYAEKVISGEEVTTWEIKKQCEMFLSDLEVQDQQEVIFYFDDKKIKTIEKLLKIINFATGINDVVGKSVYKGMEGFQAFFLVNVFGWRIKGKPYKFRYTEITLFIARKNTKSFLAGLVFILLMLTEENYSEFYSICLDRELAAEIKKAITQLIEKSPALQKHFKVPKTLKSKVECKLTKSFYQPRTADSGKNNSIRPSAFIADEVGNFKTKDNINALKSGQLNVSNAIGFYLTTAYAIDNSIMLEELEYKRKILKGVIKADNVFSMIYYADKENLWNDTGLLQANPLRIEENYNTIRKLRERAKVVESDREEYLTKCMNYFLPANKGETYINIDDLIKCKVDDIVWQGREVFIGLDLSMTTDNTSVTMTALHDDEILISKSWAFIPANRIDEKTKAENVNYRLEIEKGNCFACGENSIDYGFIENFIMQIQESYGVVIRQIGYDVYNCTSTAQKLEREGYDMVQVKQHSSVLHSPTKLLKEKILNSKFAYEGSNKLYEINFSNARCMYDTNLNMYVNKKKSNGKVDMVVSTIIATYLLEQNLLIGEEEYAVQ